MGRHTVTGLLTTSGRKFADWLAAYRLFSQERVDTSALLSAVSKSMLAELPPGHHLVVGLGATLVRKSGKKIQGSGWRRDSMGPAFCNNFIWAQRFIEASAALPSSSGPSHAHMIPITFAHAPTPPKPSRPTGWRGSCASPSCSWTRTWSPSPWKDP